MDDLSKFTLLPEGFLDQETCEMKSLDPPLFLPDGREFKTWEQPLSFTRTYHVAQNHPAASDDNPGSEALPWKTIGQAATRLQPGERVVIHAGIYRETVAPQRGGTGADAMITYEGAEKEPVILRGSELFTGEFFREGCGWRMVLPEDASQSDANPFARVNYALTPWEGESSRLKDEENLKALIAKCEEHSPNALLRQGLVFQDGVRLTQFAKKEELEDRPGAYWVEPDGQSVLLRPLGDMDPHTANFEYTTRGQVFAPTVEGLGFIRVRNLTLEFVAGCFPWPQRGALSACKGHHWIVEDNVVRDCNALGIEVGHRQVPRNPRTLQMHPGGLGQIVRRNRVERCGICGIAGLGIIQGIVEDNVCRDMGWQDVKIMESAGIKIHYNSHTVVRRNLVARSHKCFNIWIDHSNHNVRCLQNVVFGINPPGDGASSGGIYLEASRYHNMIDHNIVWNCPVNGVFLSYCEHAIITNNLIGNGQPLNISIGNSRLVHDSPCPGRHNRACGNIFYNTRKKPEIAPRENRCDDNVCIEPGENTSALARQWMDESGFDQNSRLVFARIAFDPETWTLQVTACPELPAVDRHPSVTCDFLGTAESGPAIACGPFSTANFNTIINVRNPSWPL